MIRPFLEALRFLTVFPVPSFSGGPSYPLSRAVGFFPLVGILIGAVCLGFFVLIEPWVPSRISHLVLLVGPVFLSGGLHLDGFADACDGLFAGKDKSSVLRIMKDTHAGVWAMTGMVLLLMAKYELLLFLPMKTKVFLFAMAASRWAQMALSFALPAANPQSGLGAGIAKNVKWPQGFLATLFFIPAVVWLGLNGILLLSAVLANLVLLGIFFQRKAGGMTGDLFGAASELTELCVYFFAVLWIGRY